MRINISIVFIALISIGAFGQNKSVLIQSHLNSKTGSPIEKTNVVIDKVGSCITTTDGKCFYPTLKGNGNNISIKIQHDKYVPINTIELKSYRLSNQKIDTIQVVMSLISEREKYALAYFEKEAGLIIRKRFEDKERGLYAQIKGLVAKMNDLKETNDLAYQKLEKSLEEANKELELLQKDKLNEESIAQRLAATLSLIEGEEIPDYVSQAYNFFRQGNVESADKALIGNAIDDQIVQAKLKKKLAKLLDESADRQLKEATAACLFKAQLKSSLYNYKEAEIWYEKAYQADTNNVEALINYAYFLDQQNRPKRPAELYERALLIYESLAKSNPVRYLPYLANILNNLGQLYSVSNLKEQAQKALERALHIYEALAKDNPAQHLPYMAITLNNLGSFYSDNHLNDQARNAYVRALHIYESLAKDNPQQYLPDVALLLNNLGNFHADTNKAEQSLKDYERAVQIYESLALVNPAKYLPDFSTLLSNLGIFYSENNLIEKAQKTYERALQIEESLVKSNPEKHLPALARTLQNLGVFYAGINLNEHAQKHFEHALQINESLAKANPKLFLPNLAMTLNSLGNFYTNNNLNEQGQKALERALQIRESLAKANPAKYLSSVANTLNCLGINYNEHDLKEQAQKTYERALQIYESLAKDNPQQYLPCVAITLCNLGNCHTNNNLTEKNQKAYERALEIFEPIAKANPARYLPQMAQTQINYALFWSNEKNINRTEELMVEGLSNYQALGIMLKNDIFWQKAKDAKDYLSKIMTIDSLPERKLYLEGVIINFNAQYPLATKEEKATELGNGAWYALFCKEYKLAHEYAIKGLAIAPEQNWIYTKLALALLLQNRWEEAKIIYQEKQNLIIDNDKPLREIFLNDLLELEKAGIKHPDFIKVKELLR